MTSKNRVLVQLRADTLTSDAAASGDIDLGPYVNSGKCQILGIWAPYNINAAATDTDFTFDNKFQQGATTVDSDFSDITGAAFTQVTSVSGDKTFQQISFVATARYLRAYATVGGTAPSFFDATAVLLSPRFDT